MDSNRYGFSVDLPGDLDTVQRRVVELLKDEGFGVLTEIDVRQTLTQKLDLDFRPYRILGACNPKLAHRALEVEPGIGLLLPRNVVLEALPDGGSRVRLMDAAAALGLVGNADLAPIAADATERLRRVATRLEAQVHAASGLRRTPSSRRAALDGRRPALRRPRHSCARIARAHADRTNAYSSAVWRLLTCPTPSARLAAPGGEPPSRPSRHEIMAQTSRGTVFTRPPVKYLPEIPRKEEADGSGAEGARCRAPG
jgi:uncharacterized protein (DUF302 family)